MDRRVLALIAAGTAVIALGRPQDGAPTRSAEPTPTASRAVPGARPGVREGLRQLGARIADARRTATPEADDAAAAAGDPGEPDDAPANDDQRELELIFGRQEEARTIELRDPAQRFTLERHGHQVSIHIEGRDDETLRVDTEHDLSIELRRDPEDPERREVTVSSLVTIPASRTFDGVLGASTEQQNDPEYVIE